MPGASFQPYFWDADAVEGAKQSDGWASVSASADDGWSNVEASAYRFKPISPFKDVGGGVDFISQVKSAEHGGPDFQVTTDRPIKIRSRSNITTEGDQP